MPATTVIALQSAIGNSNANATFFLEPGGPFIPYMNEVGQRIYNMGPWRDLLCERSYAAADGFIALDRDIESIWMANVNNRPQRVRSMFADLSTIGNVDFLPERYGLIDQGYSAQRRDFMLIQEVESLDDVTPVTELLIYSKANTPVRSEALQGCTISITGETADRIEVFGTLDLTGTNAVVTFDPGIVEITAVYATGVPFQIDVRLLEDISSVVAQIRVGSDVVRYRKYRVGGAKDDTYVHVLAKRGWVPVTCGNDIIHLGNVPAWKHGLLAKVYEDNADVDRSAYHWNQVDLILDQDLKAHQGGAKPNMTLDLYGGAAPGIHNLL